ncbi:MAG TPA: CBS and ACT domain-containing protein [Longimicrobiaceae bacterium]|nr:CBS and ACT domain-containing protein [Longimicrobiaceae bacterium]
MLVKDRMSRDPVTVTPDDTLAQALQLTREHRIRHLPVVGGNGMLCGILSDRDIRLAMPSPLTVPDAERADFLERTPIAAIMSREVVTVGPGEAIEDAAKQLYRHRISSLPVVDAAGKLEGILTETDILHAFVEILGGMEPASRLEVALQDRSGELARALHVIGEELAVNITSIVVPSIRAQGRKTAILHVGTIDPREIVEALEQAGFEVGWPSLEADQRELRKW